MLKVGVKGRKGMKSHKVKPPYFKNIKKSP